VSRPTPARDAAAHDDPFVDYLREAMQQLQIGQTAVGHELGLTDRTYINRVINREKPFPYRRMLAASLVLRRAICAAWANDLGLVVGERGVLARVASTLLAVHGITERAKLSDRSCDVEAARLALLRIAETILKVADTNQQAAEEVIRQLATTNRSSSLQAPGSVQ
jgi:hypothetical protein